MDFLSCKATKKLQKLKPFDLTKEGSLTPKRVKKMAASGCGLSLLYGTERVSPEIMETLWDLAKEMKVLEKMHSMQDGEIINKIENFSSENKAVLHTAMRDLFDNPRSAEIAKQMANKAKKECDKLEKFMKDIRDDFTDIVLIGIGGSYLGPKAIYLALKAYNSHKNAHFVANVDPDDSASVFRKLDLTKTLVVVISKSGTTLETMTNETIARGKFKKAGLDPKKHFVSITGEGSPMDNPKEYLASFYMWDSVGGRFSSTSMVGGVLFAFTLGFDNYMEILKGAHEMDKLALSDGDDNLPLLSALLGVWNRNFLGKQSIAIVPYSFGLVRFIAHLQQCDMESNGKSIDKNGKFLKMETGPIIWGEPGTDSQHSFHQFLHQGTTPTPVEFIGFKESQYGDDLEIDGTTSQQKLLSNLFAQSIAFAVGQKSDNPNRYFPGNRPSRILLAKKLDPYTMGLILSFYEHKIAFQGFLWNINSFDQEGVTLGKKLADKISHLWEKGTRDGFSLAEAFIEHLEKL